MAFVEDIGSLGAPEYQRPLRYVFDENLPPTGSKFRYVFNEGGLNCSEAPERENQLCLASPTERTAIGRERPSFVYADDGCWVDDADGKGHPRRDVVLVCGPNVYLCEMNRSQVALQSKVPSVQQLFTALAAKGCGLNVLGYMCAKDTHPQTAADPNLYLFLGDLHLPPVTWFYTPESLGALSESRSPPDWFRNCPAMKRQQKAWYLNYYSMAQIAREHNSVPAAHGPIGCPDIFRHAGNDLVRFLEALTGLPAELKTLLHFIQTGDMFELWLGRDYQYRPGQRDPAWQDQDSPNRAADWALEVMIQNMPVIEAFRRLEGAGLKEVKYLWGNHDAYLKNSEVPRQLSLASRDPAYLGLNADLFGEHGHRFDRSNHDNISDSDGPKWANRAYYMPVLRAAEPMGRAFSSIGHPSKQRDCHVLGATLVYLYQRYDLHQGPFGIYAMGHSHERALFRFNVRADFHLYEGSG
jgi:hypothetical protein